MSRNKLPFALAAFGLVTVGIVAAPAAHAANVPLALTCSGSGSFTFTPSSISPALSDTLQLTNNTGALITIGTTNAISGTGVVTGTVANGVTGELQVVGSFGDLTINAGSGCTRTTLSWSVGGGGGGGSSSSLGSTGPAPETQQFGLPASGTCEEAAPADLNWAGVPSGGWGMSWAQWMNAGSGGVVCTRTLSYIGSGWTIN